MRTKTRHLSAVLIAVAGALVAQIATGQTAQRTFVASTGLDTNPCSIAAPCRGFATAIAHTAAGGEVIVLDSAGYGPVTITKSISLIAPPGIHAGVSVASGVGIAVNGPGAIVVLRGLSIGGTGGATGVQFAQGARLRIENCVISNLASAGVVQNAPGSEMIVLDTIVRDNGGAGIIIITDASTLLDRVRVEHNGGDGFYVVPASSGATVNINHSMFTYNGGNGIRADTLPNSTTFVQVEGSNISQNGAAGFVASASQSGALAHFALTRNTFHRNAGDGILTSNVSPGYSLGHVTENAISANGGSGIHAHGSGSDITVSANTGGNNGNAALNCDHINAGLRSMGNNSVDTTSSISGCLFVNTGY
jgi:hypothetical protein